MAKKSASQIKQFIVDTRINGDNQIDAYKRIFNCPESTNQAVRVKMQRMISTPMYKTFEQAILRGVKDSMRLEAQKAGLKFLEKYNSMLDQGDEFIKNSEGEMKLKAFANQRALLESNPFSVIQNLEAAENSDTPALPDGNDEDFEEGVIID